MATWNDYDMIGHTILEHAALLVKKLLESLECMKCKCQKETNDANIQNHTE